MAQAVFYLGGMVEQVYRDRAKGIAPGNAFTLFRRFEA
jgi:hypothetical protein